LLRGDSDGGAADGEGHEGGCDEGRLHWFISLSGEVFGCPPTLVISTTGG
jgi:hypothetical protein